MATEERRCATVVGTALDLKSQPGPITTKYAWVVDQACLFQWFPGDDETVADDTLVIDPRAQGGTIGRWIGQFATAPLDGGVALTGADQTITVAGGRRRELPASTPLTADRRLTFTQAGVAAGDVIRIVRMGLGAYTLELYDTATATSLAFLPPSQRWWAEVWQSGSGWRLHGAGQMP
jgi:hypothetical protein